MASRRLHGVVTVCCAVVKFWVVPWVIPWVILSWAGSPDRGRFLILLGFVDDSLRISVQFLFNFCSISVKGSVWFWSR
jgi:hypothetical protein